MDRRHFLDCSLRATGALGFGLATSAYPTHGSGRTVDSSETGATGALSSIGLQLFTIREVLADDFRGVMERVAEIGYDEVEFAGYYDRSPTAVRTLIDELGLDAPAAHVPLSRIREAPNAVIRAAEEIGHRYVVVPYLPEEERTSIDAYRRRAEEFSEFGERCRKAGLQLAYHNHDFEFESMESTLPYEVLLDEADSELVEMELDLYWIAEAGLDPLRYIRSAPERFTLCHVKDRSAAGAMVSVGKGTMDFSTIFREAQFEHYFVEHDRPDQPIQNIEASYRYLDGLEFHRAGGRPLRAG